MLKKMTNTWHVCREYRMLKSINQKKKKNTWKRYVCSIEVKAMQLESRQKHYQTFVRKHVVDRSKEA